MRDVSAFGGRVDKIVGDAIVALFGAPVAHEDDAERAVRAALRMQETLTQYREESDVEIRMRIGVNTGEVLVGGLRAGGDYTAMGDVMNTASRLQTLAAPGEVLVGHSTHAATEHVIDYESRGSVIVRGRAEPVEVWIGQRAVLPPGHRFRPRLSPMVGRESEMAICTNAIRVSTANSRALIVIILGEAGVGKTRLAGEIMGVAEVEAGVVTYSGHCVPYGEANPWWPVSEALRSATGVVRGDDVDEARAKTAGTIRHMGAGETDDEIVAMTDGLLHLMGYEGPLRALDGARARSEATTALLGYLEAAARRRPLLVRLADLHWADQAVFDLIDAISERMARCPIVFIATGRRAMQERWSPRSGRFNTLVLNLDPLDRTSSASLLDTLAATELDETTRALVLDRSGGNPLYLEELVSVMSQQSVEEALSGLPVDGTDLPDTLRGVVAARLDGLTPDEQLVVEDASVWGSSGPLEALDRLAAATRGEDDVSAVVQSLADKDVLVLEDREWSFRSNLVREIAYARLTKRDRLKRHAGIAFHLEEHKPGRHETDRFGDVRVDDGLAETIARHYLVAARLTQEIGAVGPIDPEVVTARAVQWVSDAARRAEEATSWPTAIRLYTEALDLLDAPGGAGSTSAENASASDEPAPAGEASTRDRFGLLLGRSSARIEQRDHDGARADGLAALALAEALEDPGLRSQALVRLGVADVRAGMLERGDEELSEALGLADDQGNVAGRAEALRQRGMAFLMLGDQESAEEPIAAALDAFRSIGDRRGEAWALQNLSWIALSNGRPDVAASHIEDSISAFEEVGDRGGLAWAMGLSAFVQLQRGDLAEALRLSTKILHESQRRGDEFGTGMMHVVRGAVALWNGHPIEAAEAASDALTALRTTNDIAGLEQALALRGRAQVMAGDIEAGRRSLIEALEMDERGASAFATGVRFATEIQLGYPDTSGLTVDGAAGATSSLFVGQHRAAVSLALLQLGRYDEALEVARAGIAEPGADGYAWSTLAIAAAACGAASEAAESLDRTVVLQNSTYLDRTMGRLAVALSDLGPAGDAALLAADEELSSTEDVVTPALVALATRLRADATDGPDPASSEEVERRLADLGIGSTRWREVFAAAIAAADRGRGRPTTRTTALA